MKKDKQRIAEEANKGLKAELMTMCEVEIDRLLKRCPGQANFKDIENQLEVFSQEMLPKLLSRLSEERGIFPPSVS